MDNLPKGFKIVSDANVEPGTIKFRQDNKIVSKISNIRCPVVDSYFKSEETGLKYVPEVTLEDLEKFHILSTIKYCNGNISKAARMLNIGKATIYKKIKEWNE